MTDKERGDYVFGKFFECIKEIKTIHKGKGCEVGEYYLFEYVHDTNDGEQPDADAFYRKLSDNKHYDEVFITDNELLNNFRPCKDKSSEPKTKKACKDLILQALHYFSVQNLKQRSDIPR